MVKREGGRAYLLITFDLPHQRMLATEEVVGPFEGHFDTVRVDWQRVFDLIKEKGDEVAPKRLPWKQQLQDDDPKDPPWERAEVDDIQTPPDIECR